MLPSCAADPISGSGGFAMVKEQVAMHGPASEKDKTWIPLSNFLIYSVYLAIPLYYRIKSTMLAHGTLKYSRTLYANLYSHVTTSEPRMAKRSSIQYSTVLKK